MEELLEKIKNLLIQFAELRDTPVALLDLKEVNEKMPHTVYRMLQGRSFERLDVILQTPGGDIDAAFQIAKLLRKCTKELNFYIPYYAKSAGTLISLVADNIYMNDLSELGPLDTQIHEQQEGSLPGYISALNGFKALEQVQLHTLETLDIATKLILSRTGIKISESIQLATQFAGITSGTLYAQLNPQRIGEYARALEIGEYYAIMLLTRYMGWNEEEAEITIKTMVKQYPSHGFVIDLEELQKLKLPAKPMDNTLAEIMFELNELLPELEDSLIEMIDIEDEEEPQEEVEIVEEPKLIVIEEKLKPKNTKQNGK